MQEGTDTKSRKAVPGCYRWYTKSQWNEAQKRRSPNEWLKLNPLEVTIADDIVDPKDQKISFREACKYLEQHLTAPITVGLDQWPRITFRLQGEDRIVNVTNSVVVLSDANRGATDDPEFSVFQPVVIDGGAYGVTINNGRPDGKMLELGVAGVFSNVLFKAGSLAIGENRAKDRTKVKTPVWVPWLDNVDVVTNVVTTVTNDRNVNFENCAFAGGPNTADLVDSAVGNVKFTGCSFAVPGDGHATGAAKLQVSSAWTSRFACCTFAGFGEEASSVIRFVDKGGELRLLNCTFGGNDGVPCDVKIEGSAGGRFYALNCIFADGSENAYHADSAKGVHCPLTKGRYAPEKKGDLMVNIATSDPGAVFDSELFTQAVRGVPQCAFKPARTTTARYGQGTYTFEGTGVTMSQPVFDIFGARQPGDRFHSMGSYYADGSEVRSITVSTVEDVTDAYDDLISLREAVAYGGADEQFGSGTIITPNFASALAADGTVTLTVTGAIRVTANKTLYGEYALRIMPGEGQRLVIRSAANSKSGVFAQESGTRLLQFNRVRFEDCVSGEGDGGVLLTEGRYRFDDCFFDGCQAHNGGAICARMGADGIVYNVSASGCSASGSGGVIASEDKLVGVNLTFSGNSAASGGAAVLCAGGTQLFADVAFVDNVSGQDGAVHVTGGECGIVNSIIIANRTSAGDPNVTSTGVSALNVRHSLCDGTAKADVFGNGGLPVVACPSNGIEQIYYPLAVAGKASGTGAYVFFAGEKKVEDSREAGWLSNVFYSTDPNGVNPKARVLFGSDKNRNTYLEYDQLGKLIVCWDGHRDLPASMGPVPQVAAVAASNIVTTARDDASTLEGAVSFRTAAAYAISNDMPLVISDELFSGGRAVFELSRQIDVPAGKTLRVDAGTGRTIELRPAEGAETNRFFNVSGTLSAIGLTFRGGNARSAYESMSLRPVNDSDGGAVWGGGRLAFTNCFFIGNRARGNGGAIYSHGGLSLENCTFSGNQAGGDGGAVYSDREKIVVTQTEISANSAARLAGGLFVRAEDVSTVRSKGIEAVDSRIVGNKAGGTTEVVRAVDWVKFEGSDVGSEDGVPVVVLDGTASGADSVPVANVVIGILGTASPDPSEVSEPEKVPEPDPVVPAPADVAAPVVIDLTGGASVELAAMTVRQGQSYGWAVTSASGAKVSARGLPKGMKLVSRAIKEGTKTVGRVYSLEGVPSKAGVYTVTFKTVLNRKTTVSTQTFTVLPLADWAQGAFDGGSEAGLLTLKVSSAGKLNGQYQEGGRKWKLSASAYDRYDEGAEAYVAKVVGKSGSGKKAVSFTNELAFARDSLGGLATNELFLARLNMWKQEPWKTVGRSFPKDGEVVLRPGVVSADDTVTLKFAASGKVSVKGVFAGQSVTGKTSVLCPLTAPDAATGAFDGVAFVYFSPKKGASLASGYAACVRVRWDGERFGLIEE